MKSWKTTTVDLPSDYMEEFVSVCLALRKGRHDGSAQRDFHKPLDEVGLNGHLLSRALFG